MLTVFTRKWYGKITQDAEVALRPDEAFLCLPDGHLVACRVPVQRCSFANPVMWFLHTQVMEDAITLYALPDKACFDMFHLLLKCDKVGPGKAIIVLNKVSPAGILECVDAAALTKLVGACGEQLFKLLPKDRTTKGVALLPSVEKEAMAALGALGIKYSDAEG